MGALSEMCQVIGAYLVINVYYIRLWMDGPMAGVVPDVVEYEVGDFWRTFCKLEKGFVDVPPAKKLAEMVILVVILC